MQKYRVKALGWQVDVDAASFGVAINRGLGILRKDVSVDAKSRKRLVVEVEILPEPQAEQST